MAEGDPRPGRVPQPEVVPEERVLEDDPLGGHVVVLGGDDGVVPRPGRRGLRGGDKGADEGLQPLAALLWGDSLMTPTVQVRARGVAPKADQALIA